MSASARTGGVRRVPFPSALVEARADRRLPRLVPDRAARSPLRRRDRAGRARGAATTRRRDRARRRRRWRAGPARPSPSAPAGGRTRRGASRGRPGGAPAARRRARTPARRAPRSSGRRRPRPTRRARGPGTSSRRPAACDGSARSGRCVSDRATRRPPRSSVPRVAFSKVRIPRSQSITSRAARREEVLGRGEPLLDRRPEAALQEHRPARAPGLVQEVVVLAVARADLENVGELGDRLDLAPAP